MEILLLMICRPSPVPVPENQRLSQRPDLRLDLRPDQRSKVKKNQLKFSIILMIKLQILTMTPKLCLNVWYTKVRVRASKFAVCSSVVAFLSYRGFK